MDYIDRQNSFKEHPTEASTIERCLKQLRGAGYAAYHGMPTYIRDEIMPAFEKVFYGKCAYCEQVVKERFAVLDYWRPESNARGKDDEIIGDCYTWLRTDMENIYYACTRCVAQRNGRFQTANGNVTDHDADIAVLNTIEHPLLVDPCLSSPLDHIGIPEEGDQEELVGITPEGEYTIRVFDLNRESLLRRRARRVGTVLALVDQLLQAKKPPQGIGDYLLPTSEFCSVVRRAVHKYLTDKKGKLSSEWLVFLNSPLLMLPQPQPQARVGKKAILSISGQVEGSSTDPGTNPMLRAIEIENFRGIQYLNLSSMADATTVLPVLGQEWGGRMELTANLSLAPCMMLLGNNRAGKTAILQAIAMNLMGQEDRDYYKPRILDERDDYIMREAEESRVSIKLSGVKEPCEMVLSRDSVGAVVKNSVPVFILGYGCSRIVQRAVVGNNNYTSHLHIKNLFGYTEPMDVCLSWLENLPDKGYEKAITAIRSVLPDENCHFEAKPGLLGAARQVFARLAHAEPVPLHCLSEGYKSLIGLVCDILEKSARKPLTPLPADQIEGIVMIDELDSHLHARWANQIVSRIRITFPKICFIFTTHDVHCLRGMAPDEVFHLWRYGGNTLVERWSQSIVKSDDAELEAQFMQQAKRESRTREEIRLDLNKRRSLMQQRREA